MREQVLSGNGKQVEDAEELAEAQAIKLSSPSLKRVINLSGVILHTGLGRARLAPEAVSQLEAASSSHSAVEIDLETGARGDRQSHVRGLLLELTKAEDALVVNNAAAAVFLSLNALAVGRDVVLSRGQMVEIGGSFRLPDIVRQSGCNLVEVGCTNRTRLSDYQEVISENTAAILRCHPSNYKIVGFTSEPSAEEIGELCRKHGLAFLDDVGSGCIIDTTAFGLPKQPTLQESLEAGADVVMASGDKLLGGPQCGLILGRSETIAKIRKHPLARAVRVDKLTLAALEATLRLYSTGRETEIPTVRYLSRSLEEVRLLADKLAEAVGGSAVLEKASTEVGGGSLPGEGIETYRVGLQAGDLEALARELRQGDPAVLGYIEKDRLWLDPRTLDEDEVELVQKRLMELKL
jgi:L-seryl-tRNA(Ser) seleniumtransferase